MKTEHRTLLALAISFIVLGFYPKVLEYFYPNYKPYSPAETQTVTSTAVPASAASAASAAAPTPSTNAPILPRAQGQFVAAKDLAFSNGRVNLLFNAKGGAIRAVGMPDFIDSVTRRPLSLLSSEDPAGAPTLVLWQGASDYPDYELSRQGDHGLVANAVSGAIAMTKRYAFETGSYSGTLQLRFENRSASTQSLRYQVYAGPSLPPRHSIDAQYIEANFFKTENGKNHLKHIKESGLGKTVASEGFVDWVATKDRHFSVILKPKRAGAFTGLVEGLGEHRFKASLVSGPIQLAPHSSIEEEFLLYVGPNELEELEPLGLAEIINFGKLDGIGRLLVGALELIHKITRNYGVSIIVLTFLINLLLFPLTRQSFMSMKRMQLIQPQMNRLREQHKKNPDRLNKEMMELYKKHKVNPFGGCLPMILQMPVFIALYVALSKSVILINSNLLWIKDLSSPDNISLPMSLPFVGSEIHVLPLLMCAAMFFQQKWTQIKMDGQDPAMATQQKMMAVMMPIIFGFIFYSMPSGLVLYWLTNTLIMTFYQLSLKKLTLT